MRTAYIFRLLTLELFALCAAASAGTSQVDVPMDRSDIFAQGGSTGTADAAEGGDAAPFAVPMTSAADNELHRVLTGTQCVVDAGGDEAKEAQCRVGTLGPVPDAYPQHAEGPFAAASGSDGWSDWRAFANKPECLKYPKDPIESRRCSCFKVDCFLSWCTTGCVQIQNKCNRDVAVWRTGVAMWRPQDPYRYAYYECDGPGSGHAICRGIHASDSIWRAGEESKFDIRSDVCLCTYKADANCLKARSRVSGGGCGCQEGWGIRPCERCEP